MKVITKKTLVIELTNRELGALVTMIGSMTDDDIAKFVGNEDSVSIIVAFYKLMKKRGHLNMGMDIVARL